MDIESSERPAILGAKNIIAKYTPYLAISVYHRADDFYKIPRLVFDINKDYKIYFRHYSYGLSESVMYFVK